MALRNLLVWCLNICFIGSYAQIVVTSGLTESFKGTPGEVVFVDVTFRNTTTESKKVKLSLMDYQNSCESGYVYEEPGSDPNSIVDWIDIESNEIILLGLEKATIRLKVEIPEDADQSNGHACLFILNEPVFTDIEEGVDIFNIGVSTRFAINLLYRNTRVGDQQADLIVQSINFDSDQKSLNTVYINNGLMHDFFTCRIEVVDNSGNVIFRDKSSKFPIQPGQCRSINIPIDFEPSNEQYTVIFVAETLEGQNIFGMSHSMNLN